MNMLKINNSFLSASFTVNGAELLELNPHKENSVLWNKETEHWNRISPVLFPVVGRLKEDSYSYDGHWYRLTQHGFARDSQFTVESHLENELTFRLESSDEIQNTYPFQFVFRIHYRLVENSLEINYITENIGEDWMYYSVGGHPAFRLNDSIDNYSIQLEGSAVYERHLLEEGLFSGKKEAVSNPIFLNYKLFDKDAIVFKKDNLTSCSLLHKEKKIITILSECNALGIWTKRDAPFICIEPWWGFSDDLDTDQEFRNKKGIRSLKPGKKEVLQTNILIH